MKDTVTAFPSFKLLPAELRVEIWRQAASGRLLHLKFMHTRRLLTLTPRRGIPFIPPVLHACHESRELSRQWYKILVLHPGVESRVFISFEADIVYFSDRLHRHKSLNSIWHGSDSALLLANWDASQGTNVCSVQKVAFDIEFFNTATRSPDIPRAFICEFKELRSITWVARGLLEKQVVIKGWKTRVEALLERKMDEFGFEEVREEHAVRACYKMAPEVKRWVKWDLTEWKNLNYLTTHPDELDPRFERAPLGAANSSYWPRRGRIRDARLMTKEGLWDNTSMRVVVDHNLFSLAEEILERENRKHEVENERKRKIRERGTVMIIRTIDNNVKPEVERAIDQADKELYAENDSDIEEDLR